jgi:hypothetical protein
MFAPPVGRKGAVRADRSDARRQSAPTRAVAARHPTWDFSKIAIIAPGRRWRNPRAIAGPNLSTQRRIVS